MRAELNDVRRYVSANLSEGNRRELDLLFGGAVPPDPVGLCMAHSDHFYWFRDGDFAGLAGIGQVDCWTYSLWGCYSQGIEARPMTAYEHARLALQAFDRLLPPDCRYHAGIPAGFAQGIRFAGRLGFRKTGERMKRTLIIDLERMPGDGLV